MKKTVGALLAAALLLGVSAVAFAGPRCRGGINKREHYQQERIRQGIQSGSLTRYEARRLEGEEARIRFDERIARRDGVISPRERARLDRELDHARRDIYRQTHDDDSRPPR